MTPAIIITLITLTTILGLAICAGMCAAARPGDYEVGQGGN